MIEVFLAWLVVFLAVSVLAAAVIAVFAVGSSRAGLSGNPLGALPARPDSTEEVLRRVLHDSEDVVRLRNLNLLVERIRARRLSADVVDQLLNAPDIAVRLTAANAVGEKAFDVLKSVYEDSRLKTRYRIWALSILGQRFFHTPKGRAVVASGQAWLLKMARGPSVDSLLAIRTLGDIGDVGTVKQLLSLAEGDHGLSDSLRDAVLQIQSRLEGAESGSLSVAHLKMEEGALSVAHEGGRLSLALRQNDKKTPPS